MSLFLYRLFGLLALLGASSFHLHAYSLSGPRWRTPTINLHLQLGATNTALLDGSTSWGAVAEDALNTWNLHLATTQFTFVRDSTATRAENNRINNVAFSNDIYGDAWGSGVLAVTITYTLAGATTETDVLFNNRLTWNSYRGALRTINGTALQDFRRVAIHEFGHALGLDHPDQRGQSVAALMNSRVSALDTLAADDISGAQFLYGAPTTLTTATATPPNITTQPISRTAATGTTTTFAVVATSSSPLFYQWIKTGSSLTQATTSTFTLTNISANDAGNYAVIVTNSAGSVVSATATLFVTAPSPNGGASFLAPTITTPPTHRTVDAGQPVSFFVTANGLSPLFYQWRKDGTPLPGATSATFSLTNTQPTDSGSYRVLVTNTAGALESNPAILTVTIPLTLPIISAAPVPQAVANGERLSLRVVAISNADLTYQWFKDNLPLADATSPTFTIASARVSDAGNYTVRVTNSVGTVTTPAALVTIRFSRLINLSTRAFIPAGGTLTPGFYIRGEKNKSLLIRGIGPSLTLFGINNALPDPQLEIFTQGAPAPLATNHDWGGSAALAASFASVGAFPLAPSSKDAALQASLPSAGYTARITANDAATAGVTLAEIYEAETFSGLSAQLVNVSTLGFVGTGDNVLTAGFVIRGDAPKRLLIRAIGPSLALFGVTGFLTDPQLGLVPLGKIEPIATNDDWSDGSTARAAFTAAGAFPLQPGSKDAVLIVTLEPGGYTAIISGVTSTTTGTALIEIYDLDP
ncbi:MAG: hypothetical protein RL077_4669 [Verrucomicrobiota bacterium]